MGTQTLTLKLPFLRLNATKAAAFARLQDLNTATANEILAMPKEERGALTTAHFAHVELGSSWMNQTIRNARAKTGVKQFKVAPLERRYAAKRRRLQKAGKHKTIDPGLRVVTLTPDEYQERIRRIQAAL